jgi:DMSO/TMAO reductase YedYZ molybdopterin-dependent catalytic subunit
LPVKLTRGIHELYGADPERADALLWGRSGQSLTRRGFVGVAGVSAISAALRATVPYARFFPAGMIPAAFAQSSSGFEIPGKDGRLVVLNDRPINAETPAHLLDDAATPAERMFVRNNGIPPEVDLADVDDWPVEIRGEACLDPQQLTLGDLKRDFDHQSYQLQLECAGNGRSEFHPPASGNQWSTGAIACPRWTGVRLRDVLMRCGIGEDAVYVAFHGADRHLSGDPNLDPISRGVPMHKALEEESLLAWEMNGEPLPPLHGYPLRLVCGGWPGSVSGKWVRSIAIRNRVHDGEKMLGQSYRVPCKSVAPGTIVPDEEMCIIESMPVKSIVTLPRSGIEHSFGEPLVVRGHAWAGDLAVKGVRVSLDFGQTWNSAELLAPANRLAWQRWSATLEFPARGYYEVWARATDVLDRSQPMVVPAWNPRGYLNNACHRIAVQVV